MRNPILNGNCQIWAEFLVYQSNHAWNYLHIFHNDSWTGKAISERQEASWNTWPQNWQLAWFWTALLDWSSDTEMSLWQS